MLSTPSFPVNLKKPNFEVSLGTWCNSNLADEHSPKGIGVMLLAEGRTSLGVQPARKRLPPDPGSCLKKHLKVQGGLNCPAIGSTVIFPRDTQKSITILKN